MKHNLEFSKWKVSIATSHAEIEWNSVDGSLRTSDAVSLYFCMVRSVGLSCKGACRKHPVHSILSFNTFREKITTFRQSFLEGHSI